MDINAEMLALCKRAIEDGISEYQIGSAFFNAQDQLGATFIRRTKEPDYGHPEYRYPHNQMGQA